MPQNPKLNYIDRDSLNLLGLMLGGILEENIASPRGSDLVRKLRGAVGVTAGKMRITLRFHEDGITVVRGIEPGTRARVKGSLDGLLQVSLGRGAVRSFLAGEVSFSGNPLFVLKILPLLRVDRSRRAT